MPDIEIDELNDPAVLWLVESRDRYNEAVYGDPEEIDTRWEWCRNDAKKADSRSVMHDAWAVVDREIAVGSRMKLGTLDDWYGTGSGEEGEILEVVNYDEIPDIRGEIARREVKLRRYHDQVQS